MLRQKNPIVAKHAIVSKKVIPQSIGRLIMCEH